MSRTISSDEPVHNVVDAEVLLGRLDEYRSELDAREESFNHVLETGESMIEEGHFAADEVICLFVCLFVCLLVYLLFKSGPHQSLEFSLCTLMLWL